MQITADILKRLYPATPDERMDALVKPLNATFERYDIETPTRMAAFLAQIGHESAGFKATSENLNYSAKALRAVFRKYFPTEALANAYARQPAKIANRVYANRYGNGPESSGDGYRYRGRGFIQLTFRDNYKSFAAAFDMKLEDAVAYLETLDGACLSAGWYWDSRRLNQYADQNRFDTITQKINGGQNGANDRRAHFAVAKKLLIA